jgi:RNA-dependent RNA polymerase
MQSQLRTDQNHSAWSPDLISGCPSSLEETIMVLLDSGFTPQNSAVLRERLKVVAETSTKNFMAKYRIDVQMSCSAFVVPG